MTDPASANGRTNAVCRPISHNHSATEQRGFTYLGVLLILAVMGVGLTALSETWVATARREKLAQLDWIGDQFIQAISSYHYSTPGASKAYPSSLQELLDDRRFLATRRHLRTIYPNPFTGKPDWQLIVAADGRIRGIQAVLPKTEEHPPRIYIFQPSNPSGG